MISTTQISKKICMIHYRLSSKFLIDLLNIKLCGPQDLKADPKDEYLKTLRAFIWCFTCPDRYFEKVARQAIVGLGTDESSLTRVITTRRPAWRWT